MRRAHAIPHVHQFLIVLANTNPLVWRRIQVSERYSFWDLHVAIQDAMGWQDYHLHEFTIVNPKSHGVDRVGIPDEDAPHERLCLPGWKVHVSQYFRDGVPPAGYLYDFGDDWEHCLVYEGLFPADAGARYPRCIAGAAACPPEDCGGTFGFAELLEAVRDPAHPEHDRMLEWVGGSFDADAFAPAAVSFDDPRKRWKLAFEQKRGAV